MHRTDRTPRAACWGLLLGLALAGFSGAGAWAQENVPAPHPTAIIVPINGTQRVTMSTGKFIARAVNEKENIARVSGVANEPNKVLITGLEPGITRITITDVDGKSDTFDVIVQFDVEYLRSLLKRAVPTASVEPIPAGNNSIILTGTVAHAEDVQIILDTTNSVVAGGNRIINAMRVGGVQQVQLCVVVARVSRSELRSMAFTFFDQGQRHFFGSTIGGPGSSNSSAAISPTGSSSNLVQSANLVLGFVNNKQSFFGFLNALRNEGLAKVISEPRLMTLSGRTASLLDGGEQAIPVPAGLGQVGTQFEEFGTRLNFLPIVLGNGKIHLEVEPEVSRLDAAAGTSIQGTIVPGRATQRVHTTVEMEDGQTLLLGGLIQRDNNGTTSKVPILGDLPLIGAAFRTVSYTDDEFELVVMVTPHLVDPMSCDQLPHYLPGQETRKPDDFELFLEGILEAPRGQRTICPGGRYVPAWKANGASAQYPCCGNGYGNGCGNGYGNGYGFHGGSCAGGGCGNGGCGVGGEGTVMASPGTPLGTALTTNSIAAPLPPAPPVRQASGNEDATPGTQPGTAPAGGAPTLPPASEPGPGGEK
jgi:pilus assembly protein CpaC